MQPSVRCVLLWAEGKAFSVGDDLRGMGPRMGVESDEAECIDSYPHVVAEIARLRKPVVVALHGAVYGGAMEIAVLACDLRVGDRTTVYETRDTPSARFASGTSLLPMFVGVPVARRLLLLAEPVEAEQALQLGLLDELTEPGEALTAATELALRLAHGPTRAYGLMKSVLLGRGRGGACSRTSTPRRTSPTSPCRPRTRSRAGGPSPRSGRRSTAARDPLGRPNRARDLGMTDPTVGYGTLSYWHDTAPIRPAS